MESFCAATEGNDLNRSTKHKKFNLYNNFHYDSYHCEDVFILHNKPHPPPPILSNDTKVGRCNGCLSWHQLEVVTKFHPVFQFCGGGDTRDLH